MTWAEVKRQVLNLGFETAGSYDEEPTILMDAVNRAMREITNVFPLIGSYKIAQSPLENLLGGRYPHMDVRHYNGVVPITYTASGCKSLYFEHTGEVTLEIKDDNGTSTVNLAGTRAFQAYRAFVDGAVTLTFSGPYSYDIKNIALYPCRGPDG